MFFETFIRTLANLMFVWISGPICSAQEYTARHIDCNSTYQGLSYNVYSQRQCLLTCLQENCFHINYANQNCQRYGKNPHAASNGHIMADTYQILTLKNVADPGLNTSQSSTYDGYVASNAIDGNLATNCASDWDASAWWMVDLGLSYYIVQIEFHLLSNNLDYFTSMMLYLSDSPATPDQFSLQPVFASYPGPPSSTSFNISGSPGMCGRYLVVQCEIGNPVELREVVIYSPDGVVVV